MISIQKIFNSNFNIENASVEISSFCDLKDKCRINIYGKLNFYGFVNVRLTNDQGYRSELNSIKDSFGKVVRHPRADKDGIVPIEYGNPPQLNYYGTTNEEVVLHTDGVYLPEIPKLVVLKCENPSEEGGNLLLLSCRSLYNSIKRDRIDLASILFNQKDYTFIRGNQLVDVFIFKKYNDITYTHFRANHSKEYVVEEGKEEAFNYVLNFVKNKDNILQMPWRKNQVFIIDNTSVMHGRTSFPKDSGRKLYRIFLDGQSNYKEKILLGFNDYY